MSKQRYMLPIPNQAIDKLDITDNQVTDVLITEKGLLYQFKNQSKSLNIPLLPVIIATLLSVIVIAVLYYPYQQIPLYGFQSIATVVIIFGIITGCTNFTYFFTKNKKQANFGYSNKIYWRNYPVVLITFTLLLVMILVFSFWIMNQLFLGVTFDIYTSTIFSGILIGIINYMMITIALSLTPRLMIRSLIAIILGGVSIAMITNRDQQWWLHNFSFLGTPEALNSWQFNITLILSALLLIALIDYLFVLLFDILGNKKRLHLMKALLVSAAVCLAGVGIFPYNDKPFYQMMHNQSAGFLVYIFIILIVSIRWLLPNVSKHFLKISYFLGGVLIFFVLLFNVVGYLSLTVFELFAFIIAFSWLLLLMQYLISIVDTHDKIFTVTVLKITDDN